MHFTEVVIAEYASRVKIMTRITLFLPLILPTHAKPRVTHNERIIARNLHMIREHAAFPFSVVFRVQQQTLHFAHARPPPLGVRPLQHQPQFSRQNRRRNAGSRNRLAPAGGRQSGDFVPRGGEGGKRALNRVVTITAGRTHQGKVAVSGGADTEHCGVVAGRKNRTRMEGREMKYPREGPSLPADTITAMPCDEACSITL